MHPGAQKTVEKAPMTKIEYKSKSGEENQPRDWMGLALTLRHQLNPAKLEPFPGRHCKGWETGPKIESLPEVQSLKGYALQKAEDPKGYIIDGMIDCKWICPKEKDSKETCLSQSCRGIEPWACVILGRITHMGFGLNSNYPGGFEKPQPANWK